MSSLNIVVCMYVCISGLIIENSTIEQAFMYTGLTPYTQYYIHVMAKSSGAIGPAAVNNITTLAEGKVHIHTHKFTWHQNEGVPWRHTYPYPNLNLIKKNIFAILNLNKIIYIYILNIILFFTEYVSIFLLTLHF